MGVPERFSNALVRAHEAGNACAQTPLHPTLKLTPELDLRNRL